MLRRHFFLVGALAVLVLMIVAGWMKVAFGKKDAAPGAPAGAAMAAQKGGQGKAGGGRAGGMAAQVSVATVQPRTFVDSIDVIGVAKGRQSVNLTAAATQLVQRVRFTDGQSVPRGAILVELRDMEQDAGIAQARARLVQAQRDYDRWKALAAQGYAAKTALDQREATYLAAKADVDAAVARQNDRMIRAPFAGVVGLTDIAPGALVNPGTAIVTLDDISAIRVDFDIPDRYLASLRQGQTIYARTDAYPGETYQGRIATLDTRIDERTRAITARAEFPNPGARLKPGMMLRVAIARGQRQVPAAPEAAVSVQGESAFVYVLAKQGERTVAEQRPIMAGVRQDGFVEIREGVAPGEQIVADGLNKIQPGQPVRIAGARRPGAAPQGGAGARPAQAGA